jgi:hypothetical protein
MNKDDFLAKAAELLGSDEAALTASDKIDELISSPDDDKTKAQTIADLIEEKFPEAIKNKKTKLKDLILEVLPAPPSDPPISSPPPPPPKESGPVNNTIKVIRCKKVAEYSGGFYDASSEQIPESRWITAATEPVNVRKTHFILEKLANGELIEVN